jgi:hypothetical protein
MYLAVVVGTLRAQSNYTPPSHEMLSAEPQICFHVEFALTTSKSMMHVSGWPGSDIEPRTSQYVFGIVKRTPLGHVLLDQIVDVYPSVF